MEIKEISAKAGTSIGITQRHLGKLQSLNLIRYVAKGKYFSLERELPLRTLGGGVSA
ncbi:MAG: hypothetical protein OQL08_01435 [Gammaproteobacteria bacterium]|nr:hypothetical protein [Gammaproteobacteria bacterium]